MSDEEIVDFYERQYSFELEAREKITARLQLCFVVLTAAFSAALYCLSRIAPDANPSGWSVGLITAGVVCWTVFFGYSCFHFVRALWGHDYECMPYPTDTENYRQLLKTTYATFDGLADKHFLNFLIGYFSTCASHNSHVNSRRYRSIHDSMSFLVYSLPFVALTVATGLLSGVIRTSVTG